MSLSRKLRASAINDLEHERDQLAGQPGCQFVDAEEFAALAISWRKMERRNVSSCELLGLYDLDSKEWFLIEEEKIADSLDAILQA